MGQRGLSLQMFTTLPFALSLFPKLFLPLGELQ